MASPSSSGRPAPSPFSIGPVSDRRGEPRLSAEVLGLDAAGRLMVGVHVRVVNVSRGGALIEQGEWLRPGTRTELRLTRLADGAEQAEQLAAPGVAARCWVHQLSPLRYRAALVFNQAVTPGPLLPDDGEVEISLADGPA